MAVGNAATLQVNIAWAALTSFGARIGDGATLLALWRIYHLGGFVLGLISSTVLLGFGLATLGTRGGWHRIGLLGTVAGAYSAIVWVILCFSDGRPSPLSGLSYVLLIVWTLLASVRLILGPPQPR